MLKEIVKANRMLKADAMQSFVSKNELSIPYHINMYMSKPYKSGVLNDTYHYGLEVGVVWEFLSDFIANGLYNVLSEHFNKSVKVVDSVTSEILLDLFHKEVIYNKNIKKLNTDQLDEDIDFVNRSLGRKLKAVWSFVKGNFVLEYDRDFKVEFRYWYKIYNEGGNLVSMNEFIKLYNQAKGK